MGVLSWIVVGLIAGYIGSRIVNRGGAGFLRDVILGIIGALVGGEIFTQLGYAGVTGLNLWSILVAIVGAVIVLVIYHAVMGDRART
ncbi:MAG TPA: GlsB/YeaQ/YmgE family stress response membrane protein [Candidatus Binataceae bacterium]|nr:GlsB/YeaQ/YmgE family stress response membrane protein [Candidatus Binataceae bacterium]